MNEIRMKLLINLTLLLMILLALPFIASAQFGDPEFESILIDSGDNQTGAANTQLARALVVKVIKTERGQSSPVAGRTVNFTITTTPSGSTGASLSTSSATTDANGRASTRLTLGNKVGKYVVTAVNPQSNTEQKFTATVPSVATKLEIVSGDDQTATVNQALANPFVVKLTNQDNGPMSGQTVTFAITTTPTDSTGASLSSTTSRTGSNGQASTTLTLGSTAGTYTVTASVTKSDNTQLTAAFTATAEAAPPPIKVATTLQKISGDTQSAQVNTSLKVLNQQIRDIKTQALTLSSMCLFYLE